MKSTDVIELVNLSPHPLNFYKDGVQVFTLPASTTPARRAQGGSSLPPLKAVFGGKEFEIPLQEKVYSGVEGLPEPKDGIIYVVAYPVAEADECKSRDDIVCAGDHVRDDAGFIIGRTSLSVVK